MISVLKIIASAEKAIFIGVFNCFVNMITQIILNFISQD